MTEKASNSKTALKVAATNCTKVSIPPLIFSASARPHTKIPHFRTLLYGRFLHILLLFVLVLFVAAQGAWALTIGDRVVINTTLNVRSTAAGTKIGTQSTGVQGTILAGPTYAVYNGTGYNWNKVRFDSGIDGWVVEGGLNIVAVSASAPTISSITPNPLTYGSPTDKITISGSNFVSGCTVILKDLTHGGSYPKAVTYISNTQLQVTANFTNNTATWSAQVTAPTASNTVQFHVNAKVSAPTISSITPNPLTYGSSTDKITISGSNFVSGCTVILKDLTHGGSYPKAVTYISSTQLQVTANFTNNTATWSARVTAPTASNTVQFHVNAKVSAPFYLSFPLSNYTPYNAPITSVFDHSGGRYIADHKVVAYTGEEGTVRNDKEPPAHFGSKLLYSYKKLDKSTFLSNINYVGTTKTGPNTLNYDGHPGYDYAVPIGTGIHAAADGTVVCVNKNANDGGGIYIQILHNPDGYLTQYLHLSQVQAFITQGTTVIRGQLIGLSGNTPPGTGAHLHFEVKKNITSSQCPYQGTSIDPYGWTGRGSDPYVIANINLWQAPTSQTPAPQIDSISPTTMPASINNQSFKVIGGNIQPGAHLIFTDPTGQIYNSSAHLTREGSITATEFNYQINNGNTPGIWSVKVLNPDSQQSNALSFQVETTSSPVAVMLGLDVSHFQKTIDWALVTKANRVFAFAQATGGDLSNYDDQYFTQNMANGKTAGVIMGAYHLAALPLGNAIAEASHFLAVAGAYITAGYLRPALDIEPEVSGSLGKAAISQWIRDWCNTVETNTGVRPILYMVRHDARKNMDADLNKYPIWIATNSTDPRTDPGNIGSWNSWSFQQYGTEVTKSTCPGITGYADLDSFNGDMASFKNNFVINTATNTFPKGDVNNDGAVNLADAISALKIMTGMNSTGIMTHYQFSGVDVNSDGQVGSAEVIYILQTTAKLK